MVFLLRVLSVTVDAVVVGRQARVALLPVGGDHLAGLVAKIPLVHHVEDGDELAAFRVDVVYAVCDGNEPDVAFAEHNLRVEACFQIVSAHTAHILGDDCANLPGFDVRNELLPAGTFKVSAAIAIIRIVSAVGKAMLLRIGLQV